MKKYIISLIFFIIGANLSAQVLTQKVNSETIDESIKLADKSSIDIVTMPSFNVSQLLAEDELNKTLDLPYRFGYAFDVDYNMQNSGTWSEVENGRIWSLKIVSDGAYSINLAYNKFYLPGNSRLYIYNEEKTVLQGPFTSENNTKDGTFSSDLVQGSAIILEYFEPDGFKESPNISISKIVHAYRNLFPTSTKGFGSSGDCNIDVNCPEGNAWQNESNAVAMILIGDTRWCSGCMVNNTAQDFTPHFLTANHCIEGQNVDNWAFRFQYKSPTCGGGDDYSYYSYYGANLEANSSVSDFALLELDNRPAANTNITYAGWSRNTTAPNSAVGIHHPSGDVMKISFDNNSLIKTDYLLNSGNNHWRVIWDAGTTEGGSSGSPLFDPNHRIMGQLHGGYASCSSSDDRDWYGCFDVSWNSGLSQFLDPGNTGAMTTNTILIPYISGSSTVCSSNSTFTIQNRPPNSTISWSCSSNLVYVSGQGTDDYTVTANSSSTSGLGWVRANVNGAQFDKTFWIGKPSFYLSGDTELETGLMGIAEINYNYSTSQGITSYVWAKSGAIASITGGPVIAKYKAGNVPGSGTVDLTMTNQCGSTFKYFIVTVTGGYLIVYPNPVNNELNIEVKSDEFSQFTLPENAEIQLYDKMMGLKKVKHFNGTSTTINVSDLKSDFYFLKVILGDKTYEEKVIISRE